MRPSLSDISTLWRNWSTSVVTVRPLSKVFDTHSAGNSLPAISADCLRCPIWNLPGDATRVPITQGIEHFITSSLELAL